MWPLTGLMGADNPRMVRSWVVAAVSAVAVTLIVLPTSGAAGRRVTWSTETLSPSLGYASDPAVAVAGSGRAVVAWDAGQPGEFCIGGPVSPIPQHAARSTCGVVSHLRIMAAVGTLQSGLGAGLLLDALGADVQSFPRVAAARDGVAYAVWQADRRGDWVVATAPGDRFSRPRSLGIPARAQLQELASGGDGPVAAVWLQYGVHHAPAYRYALLGRDGRVGRVITIAHVASPLENVQFAINDHGAVAASWVNTGRQFGGPRVSAELCTPTGRCSPRHTIRFRRPIGQYQNVTTTLSDGGTAAIMASGYSIPTPPAEFSRQAGSRPRSAATDRRSSLALRSPPRVSSRSPRGWVTTVPSRYLTLAGSL
jgi:hypothetical protein